MNDMLNSLYDLPVPKPYTPINLSVVGIDPGLAWGGGVEGQDGQTARRSRLKAEKKRG